MMPFDDIAGRVVIVSGGAGLIAREYGRTLVEAGAHAVLADIEETAVGRVARHLAPGPGSALGVRVDVAAEESVAHRNHVCSIDEVGPAFAGGVAHGGRSCLA